MPTYELKKPRFYEFLEALKKGHELIAPVKKDLARFKKIDDVKEIYLEKNTYFPLKEYFFKPREVMFTFKGTDMKQPLPEKAAKPRIFFGIRRCDLNGIKHQDKVFMETIKDPYYTAARKNSILVGYHCNEAPMKYCFCGTLKLVDFFDLMLYDRGTFYLLETGSEKGEELAKRLGKLLKKSRITVTEQDKKIKNADRLIKDDISKYYDHPDWNKGVSACLSCGACTTLCPTCYCFQMHDEVKTSNPKEGERVREWSSCQLLEFTKVAGNHVFREKREERFKHRIYHQLQYFKDRYKVDLCVGCGRCIEGCPTRIDFVDILNKMK